MKKYPMIAILLFAALALAGCAEGEEQKQPQKGELNLEAPHGALVASDELDINKIHYTAKNGDGEDVSASFTVELNGTELSGENGKYFLPEGGELVIRAETVGLESELRTQVFELPGSCVADAAAITEGEGYIVREDAFGAYAEVTAEQVSFPADLYAAANYENAQILLCAEGDAYLPDGGKISSEWEVREITDIVTVFGNPEEEQTLNVSFSMENDAKVYIRCVYFCDECEVTGIEMRDYAEMRVGETYRIQPAYALLSNGVKLYADIKAEFNGAPVEGSVITFESEGELVITYTVERPYLEEALMKTCIVRVTE